MKQLRHARCDRGAKRDRHRSGLAERLAALPGFDARARGRGAAAAPVPTSSAAPSATCCSGGRRPTSTSSSRATPAARRRARGRPRRARALRDRDGRRSDGIEVDVARARARDLPAARRAAEVEPGRPRPRTSRAATSPSTRWRSPLAGRAALIDPHGGLGRPGPGCCGSCTRLASSTTRPGRCAPRATPPGSASSSSRDTLELLARRRPRDGLGRPRRRPSCGGSPPRTTPRRGLRAARRVGRDRARARGGAS